MHGRRPSSEAPSRARAPATPAGLESPVVEMSMSKFLGEKELAPPLFSSSSPSAENSSYTWALFPDISVAVKKKETEMGKHEAYLTLKERENAYDGSRPEKNRAHKAGYSLLPQVKD